jgi:inorganic pyrophosphatase
VADLISLPAFAERNIFHVVVESPRGACVKLKYDPDLGVMSISRPLAAGLAYPFDWGFIPSTRGMDKDPIDALVLWDVATFPGVVIKCRAAGIVRIEQKGGERNRIRNDRVLARPVQDKRDAAAILKSRRTREEIENFLTASTVLEGKDVKIVGWAGPAAAVKFVRASAARMPAK